MTKHVAPPPPPPEDGGRIVEEPIGEALSRRYLAYALSTIVNRALPDVRDGLKPVQRRVLYVMHEMRLNPETAARKCAKVVGDVMGGFHPHGDQSIYDALVRLAQDFAQRYPLVDGQGNFGNIDGDNPAAMRYTECKLTVAAQLLLEGHRRGRRRLAPHLRRAGHRAGGAARRLSQPPGQRRHRHRGGHGHLHPAAQRPRADRRLPRAAAAAGGDHRRADGARRRPRLPHRRGDRRAPAPPCWTPTRPGAAACGCARAGPRRRPTAAATASWSPRSPTRCRSRSWSSSWPG